ncbi:hypothetical protein JYU34_004665 [Plutella xylostella]|uniref:BPTI/Kunitz inhibitor domain-containing protein n=1 Tax=Plutella xylostella TaxID=51655 RepID=A0ABQ7QYM1_PLUXY|nr:hypothetical protein JYU34_004665 [Plutella xylostella]
MRYFFQVFFLFGYLTAHASMADENPDRIGITDIDPACLLPPERGMCNASLPRYYFDPTTGSCSTFNYGGCGGNGNRFITENQCNNICLKKNITLFLRQSGKKKEVTLEKTSFSDIDVTCLYDIDYGRCSARHPRYYFRPTTWSCAIFYYGACGGNANRFITENECKYKCLYKPLARKSPKYCQLPFEHRNCRSGERRRERRQWYYDSYTFTCERAMYSGCGGNRNRFDTEEDCYETCLEKPTKAVSDVLGSDKLQGIHIFIDIHRKHIQDQHQKK